jgi:hypothetical protein
VKRRPTQVGVAPPPPPPAPRRPVPGEVVIDRAAIAAALRGMGLR